ncbi:BPSS1780 family membrane protein [Xanthomonadaceae bacterium JHOS43]|nr:BPSS1780 family membrane protein [Xanthomonadaceae bacterium JHOS43]MCX7561968.1 BPSS1780 family membrane protein [Xanthomonadaceae bacterium XH05]
MTIRTVPAGNGITWITEGVSLVLKNPGPFVLMGLVMAVAGIIPILGSLALMILGPALYGGIAYAAREQASDRPAQFDHIGQAFRQEGKLGPMLLLCLPGIICGVILGICVAIFAAIALAGAGVAAAADSPAALFASLGFGGLLLLVVAMAMGLVAFALTFFAIPDVMFARNDAFAAMKDSVRASLSNIGAALLYLVAILLAFFLMVMILSLISAILAQFLVAIVMAPVVSASMYLAWKDVYGDAATGLPPVESDEPPSDDGGIVV